VLSIEAGVVDGELIELLEDALKDPSLLSPEVRARVTARLSIALVWTGDTERRAQLAEEALSLAGALDDPTARSQALIARHSLVCTAAKRSEREQLIAELEALSANASLSESQLMASILRTTLLTELGDFPGVDLEIQRFKTLANRLRQPHFLWYVDLFSAMRHLMSGRFDDASRCVERFYEAGLHIQDANLWNCFGCHTAVQLWEQGQAERALSIVSDFVMRFPRFDTWRAGKLFLETEVGKLREVRAQYDPLIEADFGRLIPSENFRMTLNFLARCAVRLEDTAGAERLYAALLPGAGTMVLIGYAVVCWAPQDRELGVLAASLGDLGTAVDHFQSALALCEALEAKPLLAQTLFDLSKALDLLGNAAAKREARLLRNRAAGISAALGMKRLHDLTQS
jgi:hypothetical protein